MPPARQSRSHSPLFVVALSGDSRERGRQHGRALQAPIERALTFYRGFFARQLGLSPTEMRRRAARYIEPTYRVSPLLSAEYEGIAEGSGQSIEVIFALSARYEITFEAVPLGECSAVFVGPDRSVERHTLIGQSWEWRPEVMDFRAVLLARCDDMPDHVVVTECGQPGKYGLNAAGVGVAETGLAGESKVGPGDNLFCVLIRAMLEQGTLAEAASVLERHRPHATVDILVADTSGRSVNFEATSGGVTRHDLGPGDLYWHTNHCRHTDESSTFEDSLIRGRRWSELTATAGEVSSETLRGWLADGANAPSSICRIADPAAAGATTWLQTLCSIAMDLDERALWVSDGPASIAPFVRYGLEPAPPPASRG